MPAGAGPFRNRPARRRAPRQGEGLAPTDVHSSILTASMRLIYRNKDNKSSIDAVPGQPAAHHRCCCGLEGAGPSTGVTLPSGLRQRAPSPPVAMAARVCPNCRFAKALAVRASCRRRGGLPTQPRDARFLICPRMVDWSTAEFRRSRKIRPRGASWLRFLATRQEHCLAPTQAGARRSWALRIRRTRSSGTPTPSSRMRAAGTTS